jgi:predicted metal-dependent TIM-barrel fold hydrolase
MGYLFSKRFWQKVLPSVALSVLLSVFSIHSNGQANGVSLTGIIDFHVHAGPDSRPRSLNDLEAARLAKQSGLRGIVLKNHFTLTADRAELVMSQVDGLEVFGGIALNRAVGGINPEAVRQMVAFDGSRGKVVWLPTFDSEFYVKRADSNDPYVSVIDGNEPVPALLEVFRLIAEHELVLAMGHSSPEEVLLLIPLAQSLGVEQILVTHVFGQGASLAQMRQMAQLGAVMELDWLAVYSGNLSINDYVEAIESLGAESFLISTDFGQAGNPDHATGMAAFIRALLAAGISRTQIDSMARENPAKLLGLNQ